MTRHQGACCGSCFAPHGHLKLSICKHEGSAMYTYQTIK